MTPHVDGRSTRWAEHREARREQLVAAAIAAIDEHGPGAGMDEIAAAAGVSRPVLYRYFGDKNAVLDAVGQWSGQDVLDRLTPVFATPQAGDVLVREAVAAYLCSIQEHPQVFALLVHHRSEGSDPIAGGKESIAAAITALLHRVITHNDRTPRGCDVWAHGVVGLALSVGQYWLDRRETSASEVGEQLAQMIYASLRALMLDQAVDLDAVGLRAEHLPARSRG